MNRNSEHNVERIMQRSTKDDNAHTNEKRIYAKFKFPPVERMLRQRLLYAFIRLAILTGLWCSSFQTLRHDRLINDEATVDDLSYERGQVEGSHLNKIHHVHQKNASLARCLAAEAAYTLASVPVGIEKDAHPLVTLAAGNIGVPPVALAAGNTVTPDVQKEALALLSGVRGRNSDRWHWRHSGTANGIPAGLPYYYSALTPQQMQVLAGQQHFQHHTGAPYLQQHQVSSGVQQSDIQQQQQQLQSQDHQTHQVQQRQQHYQGAVIPIMYTGPQRVGRGMGGRLREARRFSSENRFRRQQQRLQSQQLQQLIRLQQAQALQQRNMNAVMPYDMYVGNVAFYPTAPPSAVMVPGGTNRDLRPGEYTGVAPTNASHRAPYDPNLHPLQHRHQSTEGARLEAQLRNQHDAWRARQRGSV